VKLKKRPNAKLKRRLAVKLKRKPNARLKRKPVAKLRSKPASKPNSVRRKPRHKSRPPLPQHLGPSSAANVARLIKT